MMSRLGIALQQIDGARKYSRTLLESVSATEWFTIPGGAVSHIAWQCGHIIVSRFRFTLVRCAGAMSDELGIDWIRRYGKDSVPSRLIQDNFSRDEMLEKESEIHTRLMRELPQLDDSELDQTAGPPHPAFQTKFGALLWCSQHEMLHAGQIGLLRRLHGFAPFC